MDHGSWLHHDNLANPCRYAYGTSIPVEVLNDPDMKIVWDQTNIIIWAYVTHHN